MNMNNTSHRAWRPSFAQRVAALAAAATMCLVVVGGTLGVAATYTGEADQMLARLRPRANAVAKIDVDQVTGERCVARSERADRGDRADRAERGGRAAPTDAPSAARTGSVSTCAEGVL
jgi:hypothetical protein